VANKEAEAAIETIEAPRRKKAAETNEFERLATWAGAKKAPTTIKEAKKMYSGLDETTKHFYDVDSRKSDNIDQKTIDKIVGGKQSTYVNPEYMQEGRDRAIQSQIPFDLLSQGKEKELRAMYKGNGLSSKEINSQVERDKERMGYEGTEWNKVNPSINKTDKNNMTQVNPNNAIIANVVGSDRVLGPKQVNIDGFGVNADYINKTKNGYETTLGSKTYSFGLESDEGKKITAIKEASANELLNTTAKKIPESARASLADESVKAPVGSTDSLLASNERLISSLDSLRLVVEKMSSGTQSPGTPGTSSTVSVAVNAPVTVNSNAAGDGNLSQTISTICTQFFNTEFPSRFEKAVQTQSV